MVAPKQPLRDCSRSALCTRVQLRVCRWNGRGDGGRLDGSAARPTIGGCGPGPAIVDGWPARLLLASSAMPCKAAAGPGASVLLCLCAATVGVSVCIRVCIRVWFRAAPTVCTVQCTVLYALYCTLCTYSNRGQDAARGVTRRGEYLHTTNCCAAASLHYYGVLCC